MRLICCVVVTLLTATGCGMAEKAPPAAPPAYAAPPPSGAVQPVVVQGASDVSVQETAMVAGVARSEATVASFSDSDLSASAPRPAKADSAPAPPPAAPPPPPPAPVDTTKKREESKLAAAATEAPHERAMLVYTAKVTLAVYQVDKGLDSVETIAKDMGGYLSARHDTDIVIRVPREQFEPALSAIDRVGDVLHREVQALDVTDEYVDTDIRIKNARAMQARLKALLEKAAVKEALELEKELNRVTEQLELLEGKLKLLSAQIAYSTITVSFSARGSALASSKVQLPFPWLASLGLPNLLRLTESK